LNCRRWREGRGRLNWCSAAFSALL
jgi:hypothetical protein